MNRNAMQLHAHRSQANSARSVSSAPGARLMRSHIGSFLDDANFTSIRPLTEYLCLINYICLINQSRSNKKKGGEIDKRFVTNNSTRDGVLGFEHENSTTVQFRCVNNKLNIHHNKT